MKSKYFSWSRVNAMMIKEFIQMLRDRMTLAMMVAIPLLQLMLFGFAINTNPKHLPTAVMMGDQSVFTRAFLRGLANTDYFHVDHYPKSIKEADRLLAEGKVLFVVYFPPDFSRLLVRNKQPQILIEADATDSVAVGSALAAIPGLQQTVFDYVFKDNLFNLRYTPPSTNIIIHNKYNPESITEYNIVPALLGVILTMTMVVITSVAITRERERGTMESLLATPAQPVEVMLGKIVPYIIVGYIQVCLFLLFAVVIFRVPIFGSITLLLICILPFIAANLAVGLTFSSMSQNQLQATQMAFFFFLPSLLLSGFMFPFYGMPKWAQWLGQVFPLTHFVRIVRGIVLKGNSFALIWPELWPICLFMIVALAIGVKRYRQTLD